MDADDFTFTLDSADADADADADTDAGGRERLLRRSLQLDAAASGALGVLLAAGGAVLDSALGIPAAVLVPVGGFLVLYGAALWLLGMRPRLSRPAIRVVVAGHPRHRARGRPGGRRCPVRRAPAHRAAPGPPTRGLGSGSRVGSPG